jgi:hypothetical protein
MRVAAIAGNHDFVFESDAESVPADLRWSYVQDGGVTIDGMLFWGSPWTPWFHDWAFDAPRDDADETFLDDVYANAPDELQEPSATARTHSLTNTRCHARISRSPARRIVRLSALSGRTRSGSSAARIYQDPCWPRGPPRQNDGLDRDRPEHLVAGNFLDASGELDHRTD